MSEAPAVGAEECPAAGRWRRAGEIFDAVVDAPPGERKRRLEDLCGEDRPLKQQVSRLLAADARAEGFLERPAFEMEPPAAANAERPAAPAPGEEFGRYRLLEPLGQGGMGRVYRAERKDGSFDRQVAVKLLWAGALDREAARRFRREGRLLARLEHPHVARLYDAGAAEDGRPYLVMERVEGLPLDQYCEGQNQGQGLSVADRIRLFLQVCGAVAFAHAHLLIHRDLKPSNVLVTAEGVPKLLDFGIAKGIGEPDETVTATGFLPLTPAYASPEQIRGEAVTTASDVYSLGVLLYELLAGRRPHEGPESPYRLAKAVCEDEPPLLSTAAGARGRDWRRTLQGDLDAIAARALAKEPRQRYGSVAELTADLSAWLEGRPVAARRGGWRYRALKLARRHALALGAVALVVLVVVSATVAVWLQARRVAQERDKLAGAVRFLGGVFAETDPDVGGRQSMTATEVLRQAAEALPRTLADEPEVAAAVASTLGEIFLSYGLHEDAAPLLERAVDRHRRSGALGDLGGSLYLLAQQRYEAGRYEEAEAALRESLELYGRLHGSRHPQTAHARSFLARVLHRRSRLEEALEESRTALAALEAAVEPTDPRRRSALEVQAHVLRDLGWSAAAEALERRLLKLRRAAYGDRHPQVATSWSNLGNLRWERGDGAEAEKLYRRALAVWEGVVEDDHPDVTATSVNLANVLASQGKVADAEVLYRRVIQLRRSRYPPGHRRILIPSTSLATLLLDAGRLEEAAEIFAQVLESAEQALGPDHRLVGNFSCNLAEVRRLQGALDEAEALFSRCTAVLQALYPDQHRSLSRPALGLGRIRLGQGRRQEAEPHLRRALEIRRATLPAGHPRIAEAEAELRRCLGPSIEGP